MIKLIAISTNFAMLESFEVNSLGLSYIFEYIITVHCVSQYLQSTWYNYYKKDHYFIKLIRSLF